MTDPTSHPPRTHFAIAAATATTTLALGVTFAALAGLLHAPAPRAPEPQPTSAPTRVAPRAPTDARSEPRIVLVPVERIATAGVEVPRDRIAYAESEPRRHRIGRHEEEDHDDDD